MLHKYGAIRKVVDTQTKEEQSQLDPNSSSNAAAANSLKSRPQVLIKNINGKLTITPVPGTRTENAAEMVQQQQQQTPAVESIPHINSSSKQAQQQEQKVQLPQSNSSLLQNSSQQQQSQVHGNLLKGIVIWFVRRDTQRVDTIQDFLIKLGIKPGMHLWEISILSLNNVFIRCTKIMKRAHKIGHIFRKQSTLKVKVFKKYHL